MREARLLIVIMLVQLSIGLQAQESTDTEDGQLSKKELRKLHREERKAARYEKHHPDGIADESPMEVADSEPDQQTNSEENAGDVEASIDSALAAHPAAQSSVTERTESVTEMGKDDEGSAEVEEDAAAPKNIDWTWLYITIIAVVFLLVVRSMYRKRCTACKSWNTMKEVNRTVARREKSTITKVLKSKHANGKLRGTREQLVPATVTHIDVHRQCSMCGYKDVRKETEKTEN